VSCAITLKRGSLCFTRDDHQRFLAGVDSVVLLREGDALVILPVTQIEAGGLLLKQRNLQGDRVAHAAGFLRDNGLDDDGERVVTAEWSAERAGLLVAGLFSQKAAV
jgi:hypothetical protein